MASLSETAKEMRKMAIAYGIHTNLKLNSCSEYIKAQMMTTIASKIELIPLMDETNNEVFFMFVLCTMTSTIYAIDYFIFVTFFLSISL